MLISCSGIGGDANLIDSFPEAQIETKVITTDDVFDKIDSFQSFDGLRYSNTEKPVIIYFSGYACVNCVKFEFNILSDIKVQELLSDRFVSKVVYVDDKTSLLDEDIYYVNGGENKIETLGEHFCQFQTNVSKTSTQPLFVIFNNDGEMMSKISFPKSIESFINFLKNGLNKNQ